jgi:hypothetical protein
MIYPYELKITTDTEVGLLTAHDEGEIKYAVVTFK